MTKMIVLYVILGIIALIVILLHFSVRAHIRASNDGFEISVKYLFFTLYPRKPKKENLPKKEKPPKRKRERFKKKAESEEPQLLFSEETPDDLPQEQAETPAPAEYVSPAEMPAPVESLPPPVTEEAAPPPPEKKLTKEEKKELKRLKKEEKALLKEQKKLEKANKGSKLDGLKKKWAMIKPYVPTAWKTVKKLLKTVRFCKTDVTLLTAKEDPYESAMNYGKMSAAVYNAVAALSMIFTVKIKRLAVNCGFNENALRYNADVTVCVRPSALIAIAFCTLVNFAAIFISGKIRSRREKKANKIKNSDETEMLVNE